ncbi:hypothetical protein BN961_03147 [Afipia felis]|uniref:Uncharacterized protein n=1 Tax=Afipia felis TaxID=1035 RepID=A0A090MU01_AFIFE|nr:hypothetical protein BN961_03147 [Afipia felis]
MRPSTGITSPARTRIASPTLTFSIAISVIADPSRRWAMRGARSTSRRRSRSARATAKSSSTLPPAYMTATTTPARFSPSTTAADIDTKAIASTPRRPAKKSRTMDISKPAMTGTVPAAQIQLARSARPVPHERSPRTSPPSAIPISTLRRTRSIDGMKIGPNGARRSCASDASTA